MSQKSNGGWLKWILLLVVILALAAGGAFYAFRGHAPAVMYNTTTITRGELTQLVTATGTLNPVVNVTVGSQVSGIINHLYVDYNTLVTSNEIIAEIDPSTYEANYSQAVADLANAKANLELQQVESERSAQLFTNKLISGSDYDTAVATLHEAQATVQIKQAAMANASASLGFCKIRSPVDGVVISRAVDLGQTVASSFNTPTLFQIANDLTKMQIDTSVAEADVGGVVEGQHVDFTVDAYPLRTFVGQVVQVRNSPATVNNVVTYDCVIGVTNADYKLKPGMTANVSVIIAQHKDVLSVPNGALRFRPPDSAIVESNSTATDVSTNSESTTNLAAAEPQHHGGNHSHGEHALGHTVFILVGQGDAAKLRAVRIKTGISDGISTEVESGLNEGDQVVTSSYSGDKSAAGANPFGGGFPRMR